MHSPGPTSMAILALDRCNYHIIPSGRYTPLSGVGGAHRTGAYSTMLEERVVGVQRAASGERSSEVSEAAPLRTNHRLRWPFAFPRVATFSPSLRFATLRQSTCRCYPSDVAYPRAAPGRTDRGYALFTAERLEEGGVLRSLWVYCGQASEPQTIQ